MLQVLEVESRHNNSSRTTCAWQSITEFRTGSLWHISATFWWGCPSVTFVCVSMFRTCFTNICTQHVINKHYNLIRTAIIRAVNYTYNTLIRVIMQQGKGKAIPLQAWTGPEGSRRLRLPDFKTIGTWRW